MIHYIIAGILFVLAIIVIVKCIPNADAPTKLSFVPEAGNKSNYFDCEAVAIDGSHWRSIDGIWFSV